MSFTDLMSTPDLLLNLHPALLFIIVLWVIVWKGLSLWKAAHKDSVIWFVVLLVVNTLGILEILYIFLFSKMRKNKKTDTKKTAKKTAKKKK
ncbi:MAG: DUF5652 family protein [archaeon]